MSEINDKDLLKFFNKYDTDGSGSIDISELRDLLKVLKIEMTDEEFKDFVSSIDEDKNGTISFEEFRDLIMGGNEEEGAS